MIFDKVKNFLFKKRDIRNNGVGVGTQTEILTATCDIYGNIYVGSDDTVSGTCTGFVGYDYEDYNYGHYNCGGICCNEVVSDKEAEENRNKNKNKLYLEDIKNKEKYIKNKESIGKIIKTKNRGVINNKKFTNSYRRT
jgi:hypothetical protein